MPTCRRSSSTPWVGGRRQGGGPLRLDPALGDNFPQEGTDAENPGLLEIVHGEVDLVRGVPASFHVRCPPRPILGHRTRTTRGSFHGDPVTNISRK